MPFLLWPRREKRRPTTVGSGSSQISPSAHSPESPVSDSGVKSMSPLIPLPTTFGVLPTNLAIAYPPEGLPAISLIPNKVTEAWNAVKDEAKADASRGLDAVGDAIAMAKNATPLKPVMKATVAFAEQSDFGKAMKEGINNFSEGMPVLMKALNELKGVHPFIGVLVLAFETAYTLHQKRRDNDKKVISLYVEMRGMMGVLFRLEGMENDKLVAPDGGDIEDRLKILVGCAADDIKKCSCVCDAYMKKRELAKVVLSPVWDAKLLDFATRFAQRRQEFEFELMIGTRQGVDKANAKLDDISKQMDAMKSLFQELVSPGQKRLLEAFEEKGGVEGLRNDDNLRALLEVEKSVSKSSGQPNIEGRRMRRAKRSDANLDVNNERNDIFEDPSVVIENNLTVFSRKFKAQRNQIIHKVSDIVQREGDRVIREVHGSAHERILDQSIHEIWKEMNWRGHVKARQFVLAIRDHYLETFSQSNETAGTDSIDLSSNPDAWAIDYIDVMWVQPILEAFDDDASGFITVAEVNKFTTSRPVDWSLPHWLAFWAVGFKWSIIEYAGRIEELFAKMEGVRTTVLAPNREAVDDYFSSVWRTVHTLTAAVLSLDDVYGVEKFTSYLESEEARLGKNLRDVNYVLDGVDTLTLITGRGRIEKTLFPLLYLLVKRHYEIMRIMRTKVVNVRELSEGGDGISYVFGAILDRVDDLTNNFSLQRLDPEKQFQTFAYGMFKFVYDEKALWTVDYVRNLDLEVIPYHDDDEDQKVQPENILNYEDKDELSLDDQVYCEQFADTTPNDGDAEPPLKDFFGQWHGYFCCADSDGTDPWRHPDFSMITLVFVPADSEQHIKANGWFSNGRCTAAGPWSKDENGIVQIEFKVSFDDVSLSGIFFKGHFDTERDALTGKWDYWAIQDYAFGYIEFRRTPLRYLTVYPSVEELSDDKPRALWRFVIAAVRNDIRRDHWSWSYFKQRRDDRESVIPLLVRSRYFGPMLRFEEGRALAETLQRLTPVDACFYHSKANLIRAKTCIQTDACCDSCRGRIGGARLFCLDCVVKNTGAHNPVDLCTAPQCIDARITHRRDLESPHEPTHRLVKVRINVLARTYGHVHTSACEAFHYVRELCMKIAESSSHPGEETGPNKQKLSNLQPTSTGVSAKGDELDDSDVRTAEDGTRGGTETGDITTPEASQDQEQEQDLPTCGKCEGSLSFPFWHCIFCKDNLFICNACDAEGVPDLERSSGKHTEEHHLIRCLEPEKAVEDKALPTEERLASMEGRLDGIQLQLDGLSRSIGDLTSCIRGLEQFVRLTAAPEHTS